MTTVRTILDDKGTTVHTIRPGAAVIDALRLLEEHNIGILVVREGDAVVGLFSERDYARKIVLQGRTAHTTTVADVMTRNVVSVAPDASIDHCMDLMTGRRFRHLPVLENGRLAGLISIGDVVKRLIAEREQTIQHLTSYITGTRS